MKPGWWQPTLSTDTVYRMELPSSRPHQFAWISIAAAIVTIALKFLAWWVTDSVGLLSDALESFVNLVGAIAALVALWYAAREPDEEHAYGHAKAEYFSSGLEGALIFLAAIAIIYTSVPRLTNPHPLDKAVTGAVVAGLAVVVNLIAARWILRAATEHQSIALEASADHLIADVITSLGVIVGIILIWLTDWNRLDPIIAILVAINILRVGLDLTRRSMLGLLDTALPANELEQINRVLALYQQREHVEAHALRTRRAGQRRFGSVHILVPGNWTVDRGQRLVEQIEHEIRAVVPGIAIVTHLESLDDPRSWEDESLPGPRDTM